MKGHYSGVIVRLLKVIIILFVILFLTQQGYSQETQKVVIGNKIKMNSKLLEKEIWLSVHFPYGYENSDERYPVLYTFQTHFEQVAGAVKNLYDYGLIPKMILVRIDNYEFGYLTPTKVESNPNSGKADKFLQFFKD